MRSIQKSLRAQGGSPSGFSLAGNIKTFPMDGLRITESDKAKIGSNYSDGVKFTHR